MLNVGLRAHFGVHPGTENVLGIGKDSLHHYGAGLHIDLPIDGVKVAGIAVNGAVVRESIE